MNDIFLRKREEKQLKVIEAKAKREEESLKKREENEAKQREMEEKKKKEAEEKKREDQERLLKQKELEKRKHEEQMQQSKLLFQHNFNATSSSVLGSAVKQKNQLPPSGKTILHSNENHYNNVLSNSTFNKVSKPIVLLNKVNFLAILYKFLNFSTKKSYKCHKSL